jgi:putative glutamine amidotransferase
MQVMNLFHGGTVASLAGHAGTRHSLSDKQSLSDADFAFDAEVNSYHDFGVPENGLGEGLTVLADADGWPEAFVNEEERHFGIMWHPERNRPSSARDIALFSRFLRSGRSS